MEISEFEAQANEDQTLTTGRAFERFLHDDEVEIIDRSKGAIGPFSEIQKVPSRTQSGNLTGYGIELFDPDEENEWRYISHVSKDYLLVDNRTVAEVAQEIIDGSPFSAVPRRVFFDGKRLNIMAAFNEVTEQVRPGDDVTLGIRFQNSYDGSRRFQAELYAERIVCVNGMTSTQYFAQHSFKHMVGAEGWEDDVKEALSVVRTAPDSLKAFARQARRMAEQDLRQDDLAALRSNGLGKLPTSRWGEVVDAYLSEGDKTAWGLMNAITQTLWHRNKSMADYNHNERSVDALLNYSKEQLN